MKPLLLFALLSILVFQSCREDAILANFELETGTASGDQYIALEENPFIEVSEEPTSTFSIDADGGSYANARRYLTQDNIIPPKASVRTEEFINYFDLDYPFENNSHPISLNGEVSGCPWNSDNKLIRIGIQGEPIAKEDLPPSNFVFLIDVSGSMNSEDKLDLLKSGFKLFVNEMDEADRVAIVTYAGASEVVLQSTPGTNKDKIIKAINALGSGGGTAGAEGIETAYEIAEDYFIPNGNNRIIIGTDGDFNIGISDHDELIALIEEKRETGIFLTVLGVGRGNLNDATLEQIANNGNGTYEYIDHLLQLKKVFLFEFNKFYTVAKDVKVQVVFNPDVVKAYRLIGYENRLLNEEDFEDDTKDAGEIGADQNVTALYEIIPTENILEDVATFTIDFNYKKPDSDSSIPLQLEIFDSFTSFTDASDWTQFTASVAAFSMVITDSPYKGTSNYDAITQWLSLVDLTDEYGFKLQFKQLVEIAKSL